MLIKRSGILFRRSRWAQALLVVGIWWACDVVVRLLGLPVPAGIVGLVLLLVALGSGKVPSTWFRRGASGLLDHMLLFFVPACMALLDHPELVGVTGLKLLAAIMVGTLLVMAGTALTVELCFRWIGRNVR
ncbi:MAG: CidA/LrgA family protein [Magnetospirillum sp.]|nr:CidA/LrgA family protein [Magnetospirillum sp.]